MKKLLLVGLTLTLLGSLSPCSNAAWWDAGTSVLKNLSGSHDKRSTSSTGPSIAEMGEAFKQALHIGAEHVVSQLGATDGFNADPLIHIPLPAEIQPIKTVLSKVGMSPLVEDLELKLNRAAEAATPQAKELFFQAITDMTFADVQNIYSGEKDAATKYFQGKMTPPLQQQMRPIVEKTLAQVGALQAYDTAINQYKTLPFVPDLQADLTAHVIQKGLDGIFMYMAKEDESIRTNPIRQTTSLLKKVFGKQ